MKIEFDRDRWRWSIDFDAVSLDLEVDGAFVRAVVFEEGLHELFGADQGDPGHMKEAYLRNQAGIDACVVEMIESGKVEEDGYVFIEPEDLIAYFERHNLKREQVSVLV